jgi:Holliday junction resolvase RusA-like endonuclease
MTQILHDGRAFGVNHSIPFTPLAQARHRHVIVRSSRMHAYDPMQQAKLHFRIQVMHYLNQVGITSQDFPLTNSYVSVEVTFLLSRPDNHFHGRNRSLGIHPHFENTMPTTQGDIDNFVKFFLDAIDGIFYSNDRNVVAITASKLFTIEPQGRTIFNIRRRIMDIINLVDDDERNENNNDENDENNSEN